MGILSKPLNCSGLEECRSVCLSVNVFLRTHPCIMQGLCNCLGVNGLSTPHRVIISFIYIIYKYTLYPYTYPIDTQHFT